MKVNHRFLYAGVFLVAAGGVMLAGLGGAVDGGTVAEALRLWPVAVIALGVALLLRRTRFGLAGGLLAAAMPGLLLGGLVVAAPRLPLDCGDVQPASFATRDGTFDGAASVDLGPRLRRALRHHGPRQRLAARDGQRPGRGPRWSTPRPTGSRWSPRTAGGRSASSEAATRGGSPCPSPAPWT